MMKIFMAFMLGLLVTLMVLHPFPLLPMIMGVVFIFILAGVMAGLMIRLALQTLVGFFLPPFKRVANDTSPLK